MSKFIKLTKGDRKTSICFNVDEIGYVVERGTGCLIFMIRDGRYGEINIDNSYEDVVNMLVKEDGGSSKLQGKIDSAVEALGNVKKTKADVTNILNA